MASLSELPLHYRLLLMAYPWRTIDPAPWSPLSGPLATARLALVTSAALYFPEVDKAFERTRGGDPSFRWLDAATPPAALAVGQTSDAFDPDAIRRDRNEAWPIDRLGEMVAAGRIGSAARWHVSFNGSMTAPGRFLRESGPDIVARFRQDQVDAALLVPV